MKFFLKGFFLNFVNLVVIFYWIGVIFIGVEKKEFDMQGIGDYIYIYIVVFLVIFFVVDILKILGVKKLRLFINDRVLIVLNWFIGLIIFGIGIWWMVLGIIYLL